MNSPLFSREVITISIPCLVRGRPCICYSHNEVKSFFSVCQGCHSFLFLGVEMDQPDTKRDEHATENPNVKRKGENALLDSLAAGVLQSPPTSPTRLTNAKSNHPGVSTPPRRIGIRYPKKQKVTIVLSTPPREVHKRDPSPTPSPKRVRFSVGICVVFHCSCRSSRFQCYRYVRSKNRLQQRVSRWMRITILH